MSVLSCRWLLVPCLLVLGCGREAPRPKPRSDSDPPASQVAERRSKGCGKPHEGTGTFVTSTHVVGDLPRIVHLRVPASYDPERAYALIFRFHGTGGDGLSGGLDIERYAGDQALIVSPDGLLKRWGPFDNERSIALFDTLYETLTSEYCVDLGRVFSYGFSAGGALSNELACIRSGILRGSAGVASRPSNSSCSGPTAAWFMHDENDDVVPFAQGVAARDHALAQNGCSPASVDVGNGCVRHEGCRPGQPVVFCGSRGFGHNIRGELAPALVWRFFRELF